MQHQLVAQQLMQQERLWGQAGAAGAAGAAVEAGGAALQQPAPVLRQAAVSLSPMLVAALQEQYERNREAMLAVQAGSQQQLEQGADAAAQEDGDGREPALVQVSGGVGRRPCA